MALLLLNRFLKHEVTGEEICLPYAVQTGAIFCINELPPLPSIETRCELVVDSPLGLASVVVLGTAAGLVLRIAEANAADQQGRIDAAVAALRSVMPKDA